MPYITQEARKRISEEMFPETAGELNYMITELCDHYVGGIDQISYQRLNEIVGVLECAKQEFYRRVVAPYENYKVRVNGDVYCGENAPPIENITNPKQLAHLDDPHWVGYDNFHKENK